MQTHETVGTGYSATHSGDVVTLSDPTGARAVIRVAEGNNVARFQVHVAGGDQLIDVLVPRTRQMVGIRMETRSSSHSQTGSKVVRTPLQGFSISWMSMRRRVATTSMGS